MTNTQLTPAQHGRLQTPDLHDDENKVVGWHQQHCGPIVRRADGRYQTLNIRGRVIPLPGYSKA